MGCIMLEYNTALLIKNPIIMFEYHILCTHVCNNKHWIEIVFKLPI